MFFLKLTGNHEPIKVMGVDYIEMKTEKGMMCSADLWCLNSIIDKLFDETNNDVRFKQALFTRDNEHIIFIGNSVKYEEGAYVYGLIDINTKETTLNVEKKFRDENHFFN